MKNNNLSELSNEKLIKRRDLLKGFIIGIGVVWLLIVAFFVYIFLTKDTSKISIAVLVPTFVLPMTLLPVFVSLNLLNKEINLRKLKEQ